MAHLQAQLAITPAILTHLPLNISTLVPQELEHPDWQALPQIENITLEKLNARVPSWTLDTYGRRFSFCWALQLLLPVALVIGCAFFAMVEVSGSPIVETSPWSPEGGSQTSHAYNNWRPLDRNNTTREGR